MKPGGGHQTCEQRSWQGAALVCVSRQQLHLMGDDASRPTDAVRCVRRCCSLPSPPHPVLRCAVMCWGVWRVQAAKFQRQGTQLRKKMWWQNFRMQIIVIGVVVLLAVVIFLLACFTGGKNCLSKGSSGSSSSPAPGNDLAATPGAPAGFAPSSLSPGESSSSGTGSAPAAGANDFAPTPGAPAGMSPSTLSPGEPLPAQTNPGKRLL